MLRKIGHFLLANNRNASAVALLLALLPFLGLPGGFFATIVLGLVTLVKGWRSGLIVLAWVALPSLCMLYLHHLAGLDLFLVRCVLLWALAVILNQRLSWHWVLESEALVGVGVVLAFHMLLANLPQWWTKLLSTYFKQFEDQAFWNLSADQVQHFIQQIVPMATGLTTVVGLALVFLQLLLARGWQSALFSPGSLRKEFSAIRLSLIDSGVIVLAVVAWALHVEMALDLLPVLLFPCVVAGFSVLHYGANAGGRVPGKRGLTQVLRFVLPVAYVGLLFLPWLLALLLALLSVIDSGFNLRGFFDMRARK